MKKSEKKDFVIHEINAQEGFDLSEEDFNDIHSAIGWTAENYPAKGAKEFKRNLEKLDKKFWKLIRILK